MQRFSFYIAYGIITQKKFSCNIFEIFLVFYQTFLLPQAKWSDITGNKNDKYNLPYELPNNLKFRILRE